MPGHEYGIKCNDGLTANSEGKWVRRQDTNTAAKNVNAFKARLQKCPWMSEWKNGVSKRASEFFTPHHLKVQNDQTS